MNQVINQLKEKKLKSLQLDRRIASFDEISDALLGELLTAIWGNEAIEEVFVSDVFAFHLKPYDFDRFLLTLRSLPNLHNLRISTSSQSISAGHVAGIIRRGRSGQLTSLVIAEGLKLGTNDDVILLANALNRHPSLNTVEMMSLKHTPTEKSRTMLDLNPLLFALASIPNLETIEVTFDSLKDYSQRVSNEAMCALFAVPRLIEATLWDVGLDDCHVHSLLPIINQHDNLSFLSLRKNTGITNTTWKRIAEMMESNYQLEALFCDSHPYESKIAFLLRMNKLGRGKVIGNENAPADAWIGMLGKVHGDLDAAYYLVRNGPGLFHL